MIKLEKKWIKVVTLALGFPSIILFSAIAVSRLISLEIISKKIGIGFFFVIIFNSLLLMVWYAYKGKNKS